MTARVLPTPSTTTAKTINKGAFMATSLKQAPDLPRPSNYRGSNEPDVNACPALPPAGLAHAVSGLDGLPRIAPAAERTSGLPRRYPGRYPCENDK